MQNNPPPVFEKLHRALSNAALFVESNGESEVVCVAEDFHAARWVEQIEAFATDLLQHKHHWFCKTTPENLQVNFLMLHQLKPILGVTPDQLAKHFPHHRFHPHIALFVQCASDCHLYDWDWRLSSASAAEWLEFAGAAQRMLELLRLRASDKEVKKEVKAMTDEVRRNCQECQDYVDAIFKAHGRLLVLRVDFSYRRGATAAQDWQVAREHRARLVTFLDRKLPRWLRKARGDNRAKLVDTLGYVIGAEYGADRGWHLHATVFLNGDRWEDDAGIADLIGKHWVRDITSGEGQYENCNRRKKRYGRRLAIGLVEHFDVVKRERLAEVVVTYGCKGNYFARALAGKGAKLMIKGEWPEVDPGKGGRPRTRVGRTRDTLAMQLERMGIQPSRRLVEWHEIPQSEVPY